MVYNKGSLKVEESSNIVFDETTNSYPRKSPITKDINDNLDNKVAFALEKLNLEGNVHGGAGEIQMMKGRKKKRTLLIIWITHFSHLRHLGSTLVISH